ncbi:amidohydrolase [Oceanobacillus arenosus]|uniref:Amidohydrolase n=1 Tax=Oceanobacillus arenosus TaxID=1229153 RepID=A0A3D8PXW3_9BACI|nr:M20 family metallopeptidase [Oceanobacillus arenosus]RDW19999.1 amidohydrolase [Oceanobacillus arenosus]
MLNKISESIDKLYPETVERRRYLHQHPELSFKETETAKYIANFYETLGIPYETNVGGNGVVATLEGGKPGKKVALRADFDALPIDDEKDVPYKSTVPGVMHACGHDGHTSTLLTIAKALFEHQAELPGTVVFVHQHAEEQLPGGAKSIVESGILDDIDAVFGTHLQSLVPLGEIQTSKDVLMAGADAFELTIQGKGGHGASPHETKDALVIAANVVSQFQEIVSRRIDPLKTAVLTIGTFNSGNNFNIIADKAKLTGTVRHLDLDVQAKVIEEMERILTGVCLASDVTYELNYTKGYPPTKNHVQEAEIVLEAAKEVQGVETVKEVVPVMGGEDFSYYTIHKPGAFFFTGARKDDNLYPHHHPHFDFDERAMPIAAKTLVAAYLKYQEQA